MRVRLKGIHKATKRLADGTRKTYHYAWKGGPRIDGEPGTPEFMASYNAAVAARAKPAEGLIFSLIAEYRASTDFTSKRESTRKDYVRYLDMIEARWGKMPLKFVSAPGFRGDLKAWRDEMAATPRKADLAWSVMARVFSFGKDRGRIPENPCERGGRLYRADRADNIWTAGLIETALEHFPDEMRHALLLALWTGQRQGDLLRLPWTAIDGEFIRLRQSKGNRRVSVHITPTLRGILDSIPRRSTIILTNTRSMPWTGDGFRSSWGKAVERAQISGVTFHDLRGSAVTRLAEAGCTEQEIASITGHSQTTVGAMLDKHYLSRTDVISRAAGVKMERAEQERKLQTEVQTGR